MSWQDDRDGRFRMCRRMLIWDCGTSLNMCFDRQSYASWDHIGPGSIKSDCLLFFVVGEIRAFCPCHALPRRRASVSFAVVCMLRISIILVMTFNLVSIAHVKADYWHSHAMVTIAVDLVWHYSFLRGHRKSRMVLKCLICWLVEKLVLGWIRAVS